MEKNNYMYLVDATNCTLLTVYMTVRILYSSCIVLYWLIVSCVPGVIDLLANG